MDLGLRGRVALVGGSSSGLGRAVAQELAAEGAHLVLCARDAERLELTAAGIRSATGARVVTVTADLAVAESANEVAARALREFGAVDILVNNTGGPPAGPF